MISSNKVHEEPFWRFYMEVKEVNPLHEVPMIFSIQDLQMYIQPLYVIEKYWESREKYRMFRDSLQNIMRGAIRTKETRTYPIKFKFYYDDETIYTLPLREFVYNVFLWLPFCEVKDHCIDESYILKAEDIPCIDDFIYAKIVNTLKRYDVGKVLYYYMAEVTDTLASISLDYSEILGLHFSEETIQQMYDDPEFREMMDVTFDADDQPVDIEAKLDDIERRFVAKLKSDPKNPIGVMLTVGSGIKTKQLIEMLCAIGLRPTLTGKVITMPIENSMIKGGLDRASYVYTDAMAARKPLIANNKDMGQVGYFGKTLDSIAGTIEVSTKIHNCGSKLLVPYEIKTKEHLKRLRGKYYYNPDIDDLSVINHKDKSLIGKTIRVRSAATCCCGEDEVCSVCTGTVINKNWDIAKGFAIFITEEYSKALEQNVLSSKHLLTTKSEKIIFTDEFYKYFKIEGEEIKFLSNVENIKDLSIYIDPEDINKVEEFDNDSTFNTFIDSGKFYIKNRKTDEMIEVSIKNSKVIYIRNEVIGIMKANRGLIPFRSLDEDCPIFEVSIENNELVKPFYDLMALFNRKNRKDMKEVTIESMCQRFLDILVESKVNVPIVSGEFMVNRLCRDPENPSIRPDFSGDTMPDYIIESAATTLRNNASITIGLSFDHIKMQITDLAIEERTKPSYMDPFFREEVSMEEFFKHRKAVEEEREKEGM